MKLTCVVAIAISMVGIVLASNLSPTFTMNSGYCPKDPYDENGKKCPRDQRGECQNCVFDSHCKSDTCHPEWKQCVSGPDSKCNDFNNARCTGCYTTGETLEEFSECECDNPNFPDRWVTCEDGGRYGVFSNLGRKFYSPMIERGGSLDYRDSFSKAIQCGANYFRQSILLTPVKWNDRLARLAKQQLDLIFAEDCNADWSWNPDMSDKEYSYHVMIPFNNNGRWKIPERGYEMIKDMFDAVQYYQYGGPNDDWMKCGLVNASTRGDDENEEIKNKLRGFNALMNPKTTYIGCHWIECESLLYVYCVFGPHFNYQGPIFSEKYYNWLNNMGYAKQKDLVPVGRCDGDAQPDNAATAQPDNTPLPTNY